MRLALRGAFRPECTIVKPFPRSFYCGPQPKLLERFKASFCQNKGNSNCLLKRNWLREALNLVHSLRNAPSRAERMASCHAHGKIPRGFYPLIRKKRAALSCRINFFCRAVRKGAFLIRAIASGIASGHTILSEPNIIRFSKPASIKRFR